MATRSFIIRKSNDGPTRYRGIYCHWDGYPEYVGVMLRDHYSHDGEMQVLLGRGSISSLLTPGGLDLGENPQEWRMFGEPAEDFDYLNEALDHARGMGCEHAYVWDASKRVWEHYPLTYQAQSLDHVVSVMVEQPN